MPTDIIQSRGKVPDRDSRESNKKRLSVAQPEYKFIVVLGDLADNESLRDGSLKALATAILRDMRITM